MKNKIVLWFTLICLAVSVIPVAAANPAFDDISDEIYFAFSEDSQNYGLRVVSDKDITYETRDDCKCVSINADDQKLVFDISDNVIRKTSDTAIEVTVEYYDEKAGYFAIEYSKANGSGTSEPVLLDNSREWRTHTFRLYDIYSGHSYQGGDFAVSVNTARYERSVSPLLLKSVSVKKISQKPVDIKVTSKRAGNVFVKGEDIKLDIGFKNIVNKPLALNVKYTAKDAKNGETVWSGSADSFDVSINQSVSRSVEFAVDKFGLYTLDIEATDSTGKYSVIDSYKFSYTMYNSDAPSNESMGTCTHFDLRDSAAVAPLIATTGIGYIRDEVRWADYETKQGRYEIMDKDSRYLKNVENAGLNKLIILAFSNSIYQSSGTLPKTEQELEAYGQYCYNLVKELGDSCSLYEVWNEPNLAAFSDDTSPERYVPVLKVAYENIKKANPKAVVLGDATAGTDPNYHKRVFELGGADYMDGVSFHPYYWRNKVMSQPDFYNSMVQINELIEQYKPSLKMVATESGWPVNASPVITQYIKRDNFLKEMTLFAKLPRLWKHFWYEYQDSGSSLANVERNFGVVEYWEEKNQYAANPTFCAMTAYNTIIGDKKITNQYEKDDMYIYRYDKNYKGNDTVMMWSEGKSESIAVNLGCDSVTVYDTYGNGTELKGDNGIFDFILDDTPIMLEGNFKTYEVMESDINFDPHVDVTSGEIVTYAPDIPDGYTVEYTAKSDIDILKSENNSLTFKVSEDAGYETSFVIKIINKGNLAGEAKISVNVKESASAEIVPLSYLVDNKRVLCLRVKNERNDKAIHGTFRLTEPKKLTAKLPTVSFNNIKVGAEGKYYVYLPEYTGCGFFRWKGELLVEDEKPITLEYKVDDGYAPKCTAAPVIDGIISDGEYDKDSVLNTFTENVANLFDGAIRSEGDLSAKYYVTYDNEKLYIAAEVTDDVHYQVEPVNMMWRGDCVQFALAEDRENAYVYAVEAMISKRGSEIQMSGYNNEKYPMDIAVNRKGNKTVYEISVPFAGVFGEEWDVTEKESIAFSILANDNDGPDKRNSSQGGRKGWIEYGSGIGWEKNTTLYANLKLK